MAKKKRTYDFSKENIQYIQDNIQYRVLRFNQEYMTVDVVKFEKNEKTNIEMPFAHLPKAVKKIIKPN
ncbi:hypothetical protein FJR45_01590 [Sulfurimonas sediminis]|uniref:Malate dehydrogenase n=1 Tax=Sulfurimonas sediminis TaxID=2590020 RepID=A0A7M1AZ43_9BACT|nr:MULTISPECIES: hypothetical protein [Sulfurimonas]QOP42713.1 hypothetical protein FJR45_01590 [Sulfurimonas sediminis]UCN00558.1 hypothetical protein LCX93_01190 [Sulfurimonas sp. SWIR-19]